IVDSEESRQLSTINYPLSTPQKTIVTGCWATSNAAEASALKGVDAVIGHHDDVAARIDQVFAQWNEVPEPQVGWARASPRPPLHTIRCELPSGRMRNDGSMISGQGLALVRAGTPAEDLATHSKPIHIDSVKQNPPQK